MHKRVLIIDNIGMLSSLYGYANIAYVGGGLGKGIHNTLEAAVYGIPLLFGPNYHKFDEAKSLVKIGAASVVNNEEQITKKIAALFSDESLRKNIGAKGNQYVIEQQGALQRIMNALKEQKVLS
jgi:3-deoxy-D-manno-octulosonic-acid transferase